MRRALVFTLALGILAAPPAGADPTLEASAPAVVEVAGPMKAPDFAPVIWISPDGVRTKVYVYSPARVQKALNDLAAKDAAIDYLSTRAAKECVDQSVTKMSNTPWVITVAVTAVLAFGAGYAVGR